MAKKLFVVLLGLLILVGAGLVHAPQQLSAKSGEAEETTIAEVTTLMFYNLYPRMTGEDEFYLVTDEEDTCRAQAIAEAISSSRLTRATALSGNLVRVTVPHQYRAYALNIAARIDGLTLSLPKPRPDAQVPTEILINLLKKDPDDLVRLNAAISLGRRAEMDAYAALAQIAGEEEGWVRRGAMHAMSNFQAGNAKQMQEWRKEFLGAVNRVLRLLQAKPQSDEAVKKQVEELRAAFGDVLAYYKLFESNPGEADKLRESMRVLQELIVDAAILYPEKEKVEIDKLIDAAAKGVTEYLDQFTTFWDRDTYAGFQKRTQGKFVGIGVFIDKDDKGFKVVSPIFGSPAYQAGLKARDRIVSVNGEEVKDIDIQLLQDKITGKAGTVVKVGVMRKGWKEPKVFEITRGVISLPLVLSTMLPGDVGYLRLLQFSIEAPKQFQAALDDLNKQGMKGLIIDLRNNPGGTVSATLKIASMFLPKGVVITKLIGRKENPKSNQTLYSDRTTGRQGNYPVIMLVNGASASGAELLTGAMRDHKRATVMGRKTYGKGCGQNIFPVLTSKGEKFLKITVFKYYLPGGECVHEVGIKPDIELPVQEIDEDVLAELEKITPESLEKYVLENFDENRELFEKLARCDGSDPGKYPGFEEFYESLDTTLERDMVRRALRGRIRAEVGNRSSKRFACDLQQDRELQRGAYEMMRKLGADPAGVEGFEAFGERIRKEIEQAEKEQPEESDAGASKNTDD
jgi:carboxyl-terminal processing protease